MIIDTMKFVSIRFGVVLVISQVKAILKFFEKKKFFKSEDESFGNTAV